MDSVDFIVGPVREVVSAAESDGQVIYAIVYNSGVEDSISSGVLRPQYPHLIIEYYEAFFRQEGGTRILGSVAVLGIISARLLNDEIDYLMADDLDSPPVSISAAIARQQFANLLIDFYEMCIILDTI